MVVVAGDSDYIALAQRCKQMGRYVVGIGVAGSTSRALVRACNEFTDYARIPGVSEPRSGPPAKADAADEGGRRRGSQEAAKKTAKKAAKKALSQEGD